MVNSNSEKVIIMMATYNGEKYIRKQLNSILRQEYTNWELVIRDDVSTDATTEIIDEYIKKDGRILKLESKERAGWINNFHCIANECKGKDAGYFTFVDQDDIWSKKRLSEFVGYFDDEKKKETPTLLFSDVGLIDSGDVYTGKNLDNYALRDIKNQESFFFQDGVIGCNIFMNRVLFKLAPEVNPLSGEANEGIPAHDAYFNRLAAFYGTIQFIDSMLLLYRRHEENASDHQFQRKYSYFLKRLMSLKGLAEAQSWAYKNSLRTIFFMKQLPMDEQQKKRLNKLEEIIRTGGVGGLSYVIKNGISLGGSDIRRDLGRKLVFGLGLYKMFL